MEQYINHLNASFIYSVARMGAYRLSGCVTLKDAKSYIYFRLNNDGVREGFDFDGKATACFQQALAARTKNEYTEIMLSIAIYAEQVFRDYTDQRRANAVIERCAMLGRTITLQEVYQTRTMKENRLYSVNDAVNELCSEPGAA